GTTPFLPGTEGKRKDPLAATLLLSSDHTTDRRVLKAEPIAALSFLCQIVVKSGGRKKLHRKRKAIPEHETGT
ncbi:MAG: hypothetical protein J6Y48_00090, partial [Clostridia bacterium]|nr:hypothetical protein [Clostridia bacterium]